jgi:hypothetical protein
MKRAIDITIKNYGQTGSLQKKNSDKKNFFYFLPDGQTESRLLHESHLYFIDDSYNEMFYIPEYGKLLK